MLEEISIASAATYSAAGQKLEKLKNINFVFGTNGSGKTTLSRIIANPAAYPSCAVTWANGRPLLCNVYNRDFVANNYAAQMRGIFTLGTETSEAVRKVEESTARIAALQSDIDALNVTLGSPGKTSGKHGELKALRVGFEETSWAIKTAHDQYFQAAFAGLRNSKEKFCDRLLLEYDANTSELQAIDELKSSAETIFQKGLENISPLAVTGLQELLDFQVSPILSKKVVGKEDLDIAALIQKLGASDWVRQGLTFVHKAEDQCPFCQQDVSAELIKQIEEYFDETYVEDLAAIETLDASYSSASTAALANLRAVVASGNRYIDATLLNNLIETLSARVELNRQHLARKKKEPSSVVILEDLNLQIKGILGMFTVANGRITAHNATVENLEGEQEALRGRIWKRLIQDNKASLDDYASKKKNLDKAVTGITGSIAAKQEAMATQKAALAELEKSLTSVEPTVTAINKTLESFGFTSFKLKTAGDKNHLYSIVRADGSDATDTLSEGEKGFVVFLYFYHLLRGSLTATGVATERVVVFDDPVSSLDSEVLFIVSSLIRRVLNEAEAGTGQIKQVFVLTHNIYFHKEVSFDPKRKEGCRAHETFWVVRKTGKDSILVSHPNNPIRTSYELLWADVKDPNRKDGTIQNVLRRILENYFKILGNIDKDEIVAKFEGQDQLICWGLFSWINAGSHDVHDDLYVTTDEAAIAKYLDVFKRIFEKTNHLAHYNMMMGIDPNAQSSAAPAVGDATQPSA